MNKILSLKPISKQKEGMNYSIDISDVDAKEYTDNELHQQYSLISQVSEYYRKLISDLSPTEPIEHRKIATALLEQSERDLLIITREMKERELEPLPRTTPPTLIEVPQLPEDNNDDGKAAEAPTEPVDYSGSKITITKLTSAEEKNDTSAS